VTQCRSTVTSSAGSAWNCAQFQARFSPDSLVIANSHRSVSTRGVGPADSTGKSAVRYWPGGSFSSWCPRPENPRLMTLMSPPHPSSFWGGPRNEVEHTPPGLSARVLLFSVCPAEEAGGPSGKYGQAALALLTGPAGDLPPRLPRGKVGPRREHLQRRVHL